MLTDTKNFKIFFTTVKLANLYWFLFEPTTNIIFLPITNSQPHQLGVK